MTEAERHCPKCSKPLTPKRSGSITQWMSVCNCQLLEDVPTDRTPIYLCKNCGKRINIGRSGSFTQWIFRSDNCDCKTPVPTEAFVIEEERVASGPDGGVASFPDSIDEDELRLKEEQEALELAAELDLDATTFPLDRYTPLRAIGFGASGNVYLCRDRLLRTMVAVKCLRNVSGDELIAFQQEAKALSKLNHPGIVKVINFGASDSGAPYMVMEYIEGISLENCIQEHGPFPIDVAVEIIDRLCDALAYAHAKGIFHRDLKSSNILLLTDPELEETEVRIIDFGVAMVKHASQEPTIVQGRTVVGTPKYMAPDQALGKPYDERSEIYAFGCTMFEMLTGDVPFIGETSLEIISKHASEPPPLLSEIRPDTEFSEELQALVEKCLAKDPGDRFLSIKELQATLHSDSISEMLLEHDTAEVEAPDSGESFQPTSGISKSSLAITIAVVALVVVGSLVFASRWLSTQGIVDGGKVYEEINPLEPMEDQRNSKAHIQAVKKMIAHKDTDFRLGESLTGEKWTDADLKIFDKYKTVYIIDFSGSPISERGLRHLEGNPVDRLQLNRTAVSTLDYLPNKDKLTLLELTGTAITDSSLKQLLSCSVLETLDLSETNLTADGIMQLKWLPSLMRLAVKDCPRLSKDDIIKLEKEFPNCEINFANSLSSRNLDRAAKFAKRKNFDAALDRLNDGLVLAKSGSDPLHAMEVHILAMKAAYNAAAGNDEAAEKLARQAVDLGKANGCTRQLANAWYQLAVAESHLKKEKPALEHVNECIDLCDDRNLRDTNLLRAMKLRANLLERAGHHDQAEEQRLKMRKFSRSIEAKDKERNMFMEE